MHYHEECSIESHDDHHEIFIIKTVWSSYLHLSNILSNWVKLLSRVVESSFSTRLEFLSSTSQLDSTLFQKNFNSTWYFLSRVLDLNSSTWLDVINLCLINFWSEISFYNQINFDFDSNINWISKHLHDSDIKNSSMKVILMTSVFIRVRNLNILSELFKMISTVNDLKSNKLLNMLMKQNINILLSITTLMKADHFSNSQQSYALKSFWNNHMLYILTSCI